MRLDGGKELLDDLKSRLEQERGKHLTDYYLFFSRKELLLVLLHSSGPGSKLVHSLKPANLVELAFQERPQESFIAVNLIEPMASVNRLLYEVYANPFNTAGLVCDPRLHSGFKFEVRDAEGKRSIILDTPEDSYSLLALADLKEYRVSGVYTMGGEPAATVSPDQRLLLLRSGGGHPSTSEILSGLQFTESRKKSKLSVLEFTLKDGRILHTVDILTEKPPREKRVQHPSILRRLESGFKKTR